MTFGRVKRGGTALNLWPCCFFEYHVKLQGESVELGFFYSWTPQRIGSFTNKKWWSKMGKHTVDLLVNKSFFCIRWIGYLWWRGRNSTPLRIACRLVILGWPSHIVTRVDLNIVTNYSTCVTRCTSNKIWIRCNYMTIITWLYIYSDYIVIIMILSSTS